MTEKTEHRPTKRPKPPWYDVKCYELAEHFLQAEPAKNDMQHAQTLAQAIQEAVENWFVLSELE